MAPGIRHTGLVAFDQRGGPTIVHSKATTVEEYLSGLPDERRRAISTVRQLILDRLPEGYEERMNFGMIAYQVPLETFPDTYNKQPLGYAALASQKNYMSLYLMGPYAAEGGSDFRRRYAGTGKKLDMGKSCVRFKKVDDLALDVIGDEIARTSVDEYIAGYRVARG